MRKGFTMIELIFVIVILGILAAVAIPRLAATRDDAEISKAATNAASAVSELTSYYTAQGTWDTDYSKMSSSLSSDGKLKVKTDEDCIVFVGRDATADDVKGKDYVKVGDPVLVVTGKTTGGSAACKGAIAAIDKIIKSSPIRVGGSGVNFGDIAPKKP